MGWKCRSLLIRKVAVVDILEIGVRVVCVFLVYIAKKEKKEKSHRMTLLWRIANREYKHTHTRALRFYEWKTIVQLDASILLITLIMINGKLLCASLACLPIPSVRTFAFFLSSFFFTTRNQNIILFFFSQLIKNNLRNSNYVNSFVCSKHSIVRVCIVAVLRRVDCNHHYHYYFIRLVS